jgi:hypothetical protein
VVVELDLIIWIVVYAVEERDVEVEEVVLANIVIVEGIVVGIELTVVEDGGSPPVNGGGGGGGGFTVMELEIVLNVYAAPVPVSVATTLKV